MIVNRECDPPMTETKKDRPANLPPDIKWVLCRDWNKGIEVIDADQTADAEISKELQYEEIVTTYVTIKKTAKGVIKRIYSDKERKNLIGEEELG
jgi:hypothetical protein